MELMEPFTADPRTLSPLPLAFLGDAVYELCARQAVAAMGRAHVGEMHDRAVALVNASAQSAAFAVMEPVLTEEELAVYKRGRNANASVPKNASVVDYRRATGVEALFGYLYLKGETARIYELFKLAHPEF